MGAKERREAYKRGEEIVNITQPSTVEEVEAARDELLGVVEEIVGDFEEQRDALADRQGLLDRWEEDHGYKADSWSEVQQSLEQIDFDPDDETEDEVVERTWTEVGEAWSQGEV